MYQTLEEYIEEKRERERERRDFRRFYKQRGDVWIEAFFRALLSRNAEDWKIAGAIWKEQKRKSMLIHLLIAKTVNIMFRKVHLIK